MLSHLEKNTEISIPKIFAVFDVRNLHILKLETIKILKLVKIFSFQLSTFENFWNPETSEDCVFLLFQLLICSLLVRNEWMFFEHLFWNPPQMEWDEWDFLSTV